MDSALTERTIAIDCGIDPGPLTVARAHAEMQIHLDCSVRDCLIRRRARAVLVRSGAMVLDHRAIL